MFPSPVPAPPASSARRPPPPPSLKRPRGLWKQRRVQAARAAQALPLHPWPNKSAYSHDRIAEWRRAHSHTALLSVPVLHPVPILIHSPSSPSSRRSLSDCDDEDDDEDDARSASSSSSKRRRFADQDPSTTSPSSGSTFTARTTPPALPVPLYNAAPALSRPQRTMALPDFPHPPSLSPGPSASISILSSPRPKGKLVRSADYEDWENLKELFARAAERYDADDLPEALPLLRAVIRECHRFLMDHPDPSVVYADPQRSRSSRSPDAITPTEERLSRDWGMDTDPAASSGWFHRRRSSARATELPTAFHAIFGITLFLVGNLVAQDPSIVLPGEPDAPSTYWLAALDVFETGENLPSRVSGANLDTAEDWRMAIVWGRTLVSLADEKVTYNMKKAKEQATASVAPAGEYCYYPSGSSFSMAEPQWPPSSPFHAIAQFRPPVTRRMSLYSASAHDIMVLAMDQFSRGIFHMPHPQYAATHNPSFIHTPGASGGASQSAGYFSSACAPAPHYASPSSDLSTNTTSSPSSLAFSRPKELFTIASEVLGVAERLSSGTQRHYWASWADSVFNQMKNEADMDAWRGPILSARGRCWLVMGSAPVEDMEAALEAGHTEILHSAEAEDAREGLAMAISFFERAKGQTTTLALGAPAVRADNDGGDEVSPLLVEALLVLANLTADENKREELYTRAQAEAGDELRLELELDGPRSAKGEDEPMDVS
ncbi:hypothetical protein C2E23DRAFT_828614 [Lenzites betulinus]|nr:hypothetical protein C2E23DRAFT_828614 [Lenzites betulinus]